MLDHAQTLHEKAVVTALLSLADRAGVVHKPAQAIADEAGVCRNTVNRVTRDLAHRGLITRTGGRGRAPVKIYLHGDGALCQ